MKLDRLPRRITGFFDRSEAPRSVDGKMFSGACHLVAQMDGGSAARVELDRPGRNYYVARLQVAAGPLVVLCNRVYPYLAFVPPGSDFSERCFAASIHAGALFSALTEFDPLDADWLASDLCQELLADLAPSELEEVSYWKPKRIGDLVFNEWD